MEPSQQDQSMSPIDHAHLEDMSGGDTEFETELMQEFMRVTPPLISNLETAISANDIDSIERVAHTLKGSCRSLGAAFMAEPCAQLESDARSNSLNQPAELLAETQRRYDNLCAYIQKTWNVKAA